MSATRGRFGSPERGDRADAREGRRRGPWGGSGAPVVNGTVPLFIHRRNTMEIRSLAGLTTLVLGGLVALATLVLTVLQSAVEGRI